MYSIRPFHRYPICRFCELRVGGHYLSVRGEAAGGTCWRPASLAAVSVARDEDRQATMTPSEGIYLIPFCLLASFLVSLCTKCRRKAVDMTNGRPPAVRDMAVQLQPLSYQPSSDPQPSADMVPLTLPHNHHPVSSHDAAASVEAGPSGDSSEAAEAQDRVSVSLSSSVTDISYNKISVREPLARVLAMDHTYTEVDEERVSSFYEEIAGPPVYAKIQRGYEEIRAPAETRHVYSQPEPVYSTASIADPGYEAVGGHYPDSEAEPGYEAISSRKRDMLELDSEPGYEVIARRKRLVPEMDSEPGYEAIPDRKSEQAEQEPGPGYESIASRKLIPDPEYEVIKRSPEPLPPTPHLSRQESDLSADPGYERVRFVPRFPSDDDPDDPVYAKIEKGPKSRVLEERFCERL